jgi:hypothetical protein
MHPAAVGGTGENDYIGNAIWQVIQNFAASTRTARCERHHPIQHVAPQAKKTKKRRDEEQPWISRRPPKAKSSRRRSDDREVGYCVRGNTPTHAEMRRPVRGVSENFGDRTA